jgi:SAM-dependent methyltransferase
MVDNPSAFVFDSAYNLSQKQSTKILSVGAFEVTAAIALKKLGFQIEFIDPVINYDLSTFMTKPSLKGQNYDVIISTSVIEHVKDDEKFIKDIAFLLKVGGWGILTCDFKNDYKEGDDIPDEDFRFYTKKDLNERLLANIPNCKIVGNPVWDCDYYDFLYHNKYQYTFASFVFTKVSL